MTMKVLVILSFGIFSACLLTSCSKDCAPESQVSIEIERLEEHLFSLQSQEAVLTFLNNHPVLKTEFLGSGQYPNDSILATILFSRISNQDIRALNEEANHVFGDMSDIESELELAFGHLRQYYPDARIPKVQTMVTGFGTSEMYVSDTLLIIGLDYYLGPEASYRPNDYPQYILNRYQKPFIVPAIMLLLSDIFLETNLADQRMLADMVYYGKKFYFTETMMPCTPDSLIVWYTNKELSDVHENQPVIWANFIQNKLLFETNHFTKQKFLGERPNTYEISAVCPGRIGAWVGWEIVRAYMERNPEVTLQELMANADALEIFNESRYKARDPGIF